MKPRITVQHYFPFDPWIGGWECNGSGCRGVGRTPKEAYSAWHWSAHYNQNACRPGAFIEQHLCPPKPGRWARFWAACLGPDVDIFARVGAR